MTVLNKIYWYGGTFNQSDLECTCFSQFYNTFVTNLGCYFARVLLENLVVIARLLGLDVGRTMVCMNTDVEKRKSCVKM